MASHHRGEAPGAPRACRKIFHAELFPRELAQVLQAPTELRRSPRERGSAAGGRAVSVVADAQPGPPGHTVDICRSGWSGAWRASRWAPHPDQARACRGRAGGPRRARCGTITWSPPSTSGMASPARIRGGDVSQIVEQGEAHRRAFVHRRRVGSGAEGSSSASPSGRDARCKPGFDTVVARARGQRRGESARAEGGNTDDTDRAGWHRQDWRGSSTRGGVRCWFGRAFVQCRAGRPGGGTAGRQARADDRRVIASPLQSFVVGWNGSCPVFRCRRIGPGDRSCQASQPGFEGGEAGEHQAVAWSQRRWQWRRRGGRLGAGRVVITLGGQRPDARGAAAGAGVAAQAGASSFM